MTQPLEERFVQRFHERYTPVTESGCWLWDRAHSKAGYGQIGIGSKVVYAHRLSYELHYGPIPEGLHIIHSCDCRSCVNPAHLSAGTHQDNMTDMVNKGRQPGGAMVIGEDHGNAKLTENQVREIRADSRTQREIAAAYGVHQALISGIKLRKSWRHM